MKRSFFLPDFSQAMSALEAEYKTAAFPVLTTELFPTRATSVTTFQLYLYVKTWLDFFPDSISI